MTTADSKIKAAIAGDVDQLSQLLEQFGPQVRQRLQGKIDVRWQSLLSEDDVMQETYAQAFLGIGRFQPPLGAADAAFASWLSRIARNNLLDAVKGLKTAKAGGDRRRIQMQDKDSSCLDLCENLGYTTTTPSRVAAGREAKLALQEKLQHLPEAYQQVVYRYDLDGEPAEAVATEAGCSLGAMYMRRARAHDMLRGLLGGPLGESI